MKRQMPSFLLVAMLIGSVPLAFAPDGMQSSLPDVAFEAASVRVLDGPPQFGPDPAPGRFARRDTTLHALILYAYRITNVRLAGGPDWVNTNRYQVNAVAAGRPNDGEIRRMVQQLLADRFKLRVHREVRELTRAVLTVAREDRRLGPRLRETDFDCTPFLGEGIDQAIVPRDDRGAPRCGLRAVQGPDRITIIMNGTSLDGLVPTLEGRTQAPVIDQTGLMQRYDLDVTTVRGTPTSPAALAAPGDVPTTIETALDEQLGLRLRRDRGPVDVLVIDAAELPNVD